MAILAECPRCHKKQANKNRLCACGEDLVKAKRGQREDDLHRAMSVYTTWLNGQIANVDQSVDKDYQSL